MKASGIMVLIFVLLLFANSASGENFTLTDDGLMALDWISGNYTAILLEKTNVPGIGVRFVIEFQGNEPQDQGFHYVSHEDYGAGLLTDIDVSIYDYYELKFTLLSIHSDPPADPGAVLGVGALIGPYDDHYSAFDPEGLDLDPDSEYDTTAISSTPVRLDNTASLLGFVAYFPWLEQWSPLGTTVTLLVEAVPGAVAIPDLPNIYFVDADAATEGDGRSWMRAFPRLQDALAIAEAGDEIRVAQGVYKPAVYVPPPPPLGGNINKQDVTVTTISREATFQLISGVTIKGGYAGFGEPDPNARDIELYETILSGDIAGDDGPNFANNSENSYHVVTANGCDLTALLDGFTITAGNANEDYPSQHANGGGMYNNTSSPVVTNCTFTGNRAGYGGGMLNYFSNPTITNCTFSGNTAGSGGGMSNWENSNLTVSNCIFGNNTSANFGGGMYNYDSSPIVTNSSFIGNSAYFAGGGMVNSNDSNSTVTNCTFIGNSAGNSGGGMGNFESDPFVNNCILWGDTPDEIWLASGTLVITYSDIQGGWPGAGNIDADPCFVDAGGGDLRLLPDSPCIDAGYNDAPNLPATDLDGHPRVIDGDCNDTEVVDMGAYEFNYAYMGDFDYSCGVNFADFSIIALAWMAEPGDHNWDPTCNIGVPPDSLIDWRDVAILCDNWLADNNPGRYCIVEGDVKYCIRTDKSVYHLGETVGIFYRITNLGSVPVNLGWAPIPPFCYRFVIVDSNGEHVWLWSWVMPPSPPVKFILNAYESKEYEIGWDMINDNETYESGDDFPAGPGVYKITGELLTGSEEDRVKVSVNINVRE